MPEVEVIVACREIRTDVVEVEEMVARIPDETSPCRCSGRHREAQDAMVPGA